MGSQIGFEMSLIIVEGTWTMCQFHDSSGNGFGDIWWTDNPIYFISTVEPLIYDLPPHERPPAIYDHISCNGW